MALLEFDEPLNRAVIKVIGVGGGGGNAINTMIAAKVDGVEFIAANTDLQSLETNSATVKCQLGCNVTRGLGAGANPEIGRKSALEDKERIAEVLKGADMVFVTCGMGGGTGTGAAPIIAEVAKEQGALTVAVVTKPFIFEGKPRRRHADEGIKALADVVDTLIVIPNDRLQQVAGQKMSFVDAFRKVDEVLVNAVAGITDLISVPGLVNVDFADVRTIMQQSGRALMGTGRASGDNRATEAARQAISSPLLEDVSIEGATGVLINITGGADLTLAEVTEAATMIEAAAHDDANIIFGSVIDPNMKDEVRLTVIATGFDRTRAESAKATATAVSQAVATRRPAPPTQMALGYTPPAPAPQPAAPAPVLPPAASVPTTFPGAPVIPREYSARSSLAGAPPPLPPQLPLPPPPAVVPQPVGPVSGRVTDEEWFASAPIAVAAPPPPAPARRPSGSMPIVVPPPGPPVRDGAPLVSLDIDVSEDETDPGSILSPPPSRAHRVERSGPVLARMHASSLSPQDEAEIDIPTFLRRQPTSHD
jgi:cell division protein FtsZ